MVSDRLTLCSRRNTYHLTSVCVISILDLQQEKDHCEYRISQLECELRVAASQASVDTIEKETSIDSDIMSVDNDIVSHPGKPIAA